LIDLAFVELEEIVQRSAGDSVRLYGRTSAYVQAERHHLALRIIRRAFAGLAVTGHPSLPRTLWKMLYPFAWRAEVGQAARRAGLDPFLVTRWCARSRAATRGPSRARALMPATAQPRAAVRGGRSGAIS
jgi:hypothetical protein